jgi:ketosteroid isomerase-like protein
MARVTSILCAAATAAAVVASLAAGPAPNAVGVEIRAMERQWNEARAKADVAMLDRMLAPDWTVTHGDGTMNTKAEYLADLKSGARTFSGAVKEDDVVVRVYGDTAVASGTSDSAVTYNGKPSGGSLRFTRVYVKRDGRWVMIVSHATRRQP